MAARVANVALDCDDVLKVAEFWSTVLGRPVDVGASREFATIGGFDAGRAEAAWYFNRVPEPKRAKNRLHIDLVDPDPGVVDKLVRAGATVVGSHEVSPGGHHWTVLQDPEGNEFCIAEKPFTG
jgi:predicted enzyme related to lactoylglutathione lyase